MKLFLCLVVLTIVATYSAKAAPQFGFSGEAASANAQSQTFNQGGGGFNGISPYGAGFGPFGGGGGGGFSGSSSGASAQTQSFNQGGGFGFGGGLSGSAASANAQSQSFNQGGGGFGGLSGSSAGASAQSQNFNAY